MSGCERVLQRLRQGPATHLELYELGVVAHSRISNLRAKGYRIECARDGDLYIYRLLSEREPSAETALSVGARPVAQAITGEPASRSESSLQFDGTGPRARGGDSLAMQSAHDSCPAVEPAPVLSSPSATALPHPLVVADGQLSLEEVAA